MKAIKYSEEAKSMLFKAANQLKSKSFEIKDKVSEFITEADFRHMSHVNIKTLFIIGLLVLCASLFLSLNKSIREIQTQNREILSILIPNGVEIKEVNGIQNRQYIVTCKEAIHKTLHWYSDWQEVKTNLKERVIKETGVSQISVKIGEQPGRNHDLVFYAGQKYIKFDFN